MNICEYCAGTNYLSMDVDDGEGHTMRRVGNMKKCICQIEK